MTRSRSALLSLAALAWTGLAHAQPLDKDADADRLFKEGQTLMEARRFAEACPKLELAYKKDQQLGTLINLAYCHKEQGSTWLAWVEFREAEAKATEQKRIDRRDFAREKMKDLEKSLSKLVVDPKAGIELVEVDVDDRRVYDAEKGVPFSAEPGPRKITLHAKGKKPGVLLVNIAPAKESREKVQHVTIPELANDDLGGVPPLVDTPPPSHIYNPTEPPPPVTPEKSSWSGQKTLAVVAGLVGLGGVAVGTVFGIKTMNSSCNRLASERPVTKCTAGDRSDASQDASFSTIGFIAGGVLLGGAIVLWITAPSGRASAQASVGPNWAGLSGTF